MKQFSLEEFKKDPNRKIVTRDGHSVRIICTDSRCNYPVVGLVTQDDNYEYTYNFRKDGFVTSYGESDLDLFFSPNKKEGWINLYRVNYGNGFRVEQSVIHDTKEKALSNALGVGYIDTVHIEWEE